MSKKSIFDVKLSKFDETFLQTLRLYYVYGFSPTKLDKKAYKKHFKDIANTLKDDWEIVEKNGRNKGPGDRYITIDSYESNTTFNDFYFRKNFSMTKEMLNSILLFCKDYFYEPDDDLQELFDKFIRINSDQPRKINGIDDNEEQELSDITLQKYGRFVCTYRDVMTHLILGDYKKDDIYTSFNRNVLTIEIMNLFNDPKTFFNSYFNHDKTANKRIDASRKAFEANMSNLIDLGIIENIAEDRETRRNFKRSFLEKADAYFPYYHLQDKGMKNKKTDRGIYHQISFTASDLNNDLSMNNDLLQRMKYFASFFSQYMIFSVLGELLEKRISAILPTHQDENAIFRYKHNYIMESIYDFHLLDLLIAIENRYYCKLKIVSNPRKENFTELFVSPLEIRISTSNGREHLIYYDPFHHSLGSTRIDYLSEIQIYTKIKEVISSNGNQLTSTQLQSNTTKQEIKHAKEMKNYLWGVDTGSLTGFPLNQRKQKPIHVRMVLQYDHTKDQSLYNKLVREKRHGTISKKANKLIYDIDVLAPREMTPWIRSYYSHIIALDPPSSSPYFIVNLEEELNNLHGYYQNGNTLKSYHSTSDNSDQEELRINGILYDRSKNATKTHGALFNEYLSFQTKEIIDTIMDSPSNDIPIEDIAEKDKQINHIDIHDPKIQDLLNSFTCSHLDNAHYLGTILPFTNMELRYLKTCLQDPYAQCFFDQSEINEIVDYIDKHEPENIKPFDSHYINYYDLPAVAEIQHSHLFIQNLRTLFRLLALQEHHEISFQYGSDKNNVMKCQPLWIEFDKQTHIFHLIALQGHQLEKYLLDDIGPNITETEDSYDYKEALQKAKKIRKDNYTSLTFTFRNTRNMADRVLNDFMPWKKECQYDYSKELFSLTLYFEEPDKEDIIERIIKYGYFMRVESSSDNSSQAIYKEILKRIEKQKALSTQF